VSTAAVSNAEVLRLVLSHVAAVMGLSADELGPGSRLAEDLHADSLDLVEVVEGVERDLLARGVVAALPDAELLIVGSAADIAERVWRSAGPAPGAGRPAGRGDTR
jgi:acyl carrier protein